MKRHHILMALLVTAFMFPFFGNISNTGANPMGDHSGMPPMGHNTGANPMGDHSGMPPMGHNTGANPNTGN
jgi:hypothetical protein